MWGTISFNEFLRGLPCHCRRAVDFVHQAFDILDKSGDGVTGDLERPTAHHDTLMKEERRSKRRVLLDQFEVAMAMVTAWSQSKSSRVLHEFVGIHR